MPKFVATFRATFDTATEADAMLATDLMVDMCQRALNEDENPEGSEFVMTQLTTIMDSLEPAELVIRLKQTRNDLIRMNFKETYQLAQELDKVIHAIYHRADSTEIVKQYDYGSFYDAVDSIKRGENPL